MHWACLSRFCYLSLFFKTWFVFFIPLSLLLEIPPWIAYLPFLCFPLPILGTPLTHLPVFSTPFSRLHALNVPLVFYYYLIFLLHFSSAFLFYIGFDFPALGTPFTFLYYRFQEKPISFITLLFVSRFIQRLWLACTKHAFRFATFLY